LQGAEFATYSFRDLACGHVVARRSYGRKKWDEWFQEFAAKIVDLKVSSGNLVK
jgi:hypothetical protein